MRSRLAATVLLAFALLAPAGCSSGEDAAVSSAPPVTSAAAGPTPTPPSPSPKPSAKPSPKPTAKPPPTLTSNPLTGGPLLTGPVIAVKIDNTAAGLPQFNVAEADLVYVEQVEGGLTRLMAVYHTTVPGEVGAVRSVRSTDAELLPVFGTPALVFSGGADGPLNALAATPAVAVSEDSGAAGFWRSDAAGGTYNLHADLQEIAAAHPELTAPYDIGLRFAADDPRVAAAPAATSLAVQYQAARTEFAFADGRYRLLRDGSEQSDASGAPIVADNVLFQSVGFEPDGTVDSVGSPSFISHTVGSGTFELFRDGHRITGNWSRPAADQPTQYLDGAGKPVLLKPGKTWVALVPPVASEEIS